MLEYRIDEFIVKRVKRGWVVVNTKGGYKNHSHFCFSKKAAVRCAIYAARRIIRPSEGHYMLEACYRVSTDARYRQRLKKRMERLESDACKGAKENYINFVFV
ncbi:MAG TPA: hypothetical protein PLV82_04420 [bacterium]|nr:hypothetical protein [bacterium]